MIKVRPKMAAANIIHHVIKFATLLGIIIGFIDCTMYVRKDSHAFRTLVTDTSISHRPFNELDLSKQKSKEHNLPFIYTGVDSFELRIWITGMTILKDLIILRYSQNRWIAKEYYYHYKNSENLDSERVVNVPLRKNIDKIPAFFLNDDILNLPSQQAIPNFRDNIGDGQSCLIEFSTKQFYKVLEYHCPEHFSSEINNRKFMEIITFLNGYFHFYVPWCKPE